MLHVVADASGKGNSKEQNGRFNRIAAVEITSAFESATTTVRPLITSAAAAAAAAAVAGVVLISGSVNGFIAVYLVFQANNVCFTVKLTRTRVSSSCNFKT